MGAVNRPKIQMGLLSAEDTHHGSLSRLPGLRIGTRRAFSPGFPLAGQWHSAADSPLTVTGSLGICTRFPFTPTARLGTEGADFCVHSILSADSSLCQWKKKKFPAEEALSREKGTF